jgi:hypothetical protein
VEESIRAGALQGFDRVVRDLGGDPERLLRRNGLDPRSLRNPESMVSLAKVALLVEDAARTLQCPTLGLRVGSQQDVAVLGPVAVVIRNTNTVREAILKASRYLFMHSPSYEVSLEDPSSHLPDCVTLRFDIKLESAVPQRQLIDGLLASTFQIVQLLSPNPIRLRGVSIPHTPTGPRSAYRACFNAPVSFEQPFAGLHAGREILQSKMSDIGPYLREQALAYVASHQLEGGRLVSGRVRSALKSTVGANRGTKGEIAELLRGDPRGGIPSRDPTPAAGNRDTPGPSGCRARVLGAIRDEPFRQAVVRRHPRAAPSKPRWLGRPWRAGKAERAVDVRHHRRGRYPTDRRVVSRYPIVGRRVEHASSAERMPPPQPVACRIVLGEDGGRVRGDGRTQHGRSGNSNCECRSGQRAAHY